MVISRKCFILITDGGSDDVALAMEAKDRLIFARNHCQGNSDWSSRYG